MAIKLCQSAECTTVIKNGHGACVDPTISYEGLVLAKYERNGYDDSDFYAIVWDVEGGKFKHVEYASTRGWTYHNSATVDATPEIIALAEVELARILASRAIADEMRMNAKPFKGSVVKSLAKRGKNVGVVGTVMWQGVDGYKSSRYLTVYKVGIKVEGEAKLRYMSEDDVTILNPEPVDVEAITERAKVHARQHHWRISL